ncbi:MAG: hypothetical protein U0168_15195 [Nannocystaceae bacterium]
MSKSPQQIVTERYGDKTKLIEAVVGLVEAGAGESAEQHKRRLRNVSNAKLLHLVAIGERVKQLGGRDAIVKQILELKRQPKDHEYGDKLRRLSLARIVDLLGSLQRAAKRGAKAAPAAKPAAGGKKTAKAAPKAQTKSR